MARNHPGRPRPSRAGAQGLSVADLELAIIGNGSYSALIDRLGRIVVLSAPLRR